MSGVIKIIVVGVLLYTIYSIYGEDINNGIIYLVEKINSLGCIMPVQIVYLLLYVLIILIVKSFISLNK